MNNHNAAAHGRGHGGGVGQPQNHHATMGNPAAGAAAGGPASSSPYAQQPSFFLGSPVTKFMCMFWAVGYLLVVRNSHGEGGSSGSGGGSGSQHASNQDYRVGMFNGPLSLPSILFFQPDKWFFSSAFELVAGTAFLAQYLRRLERELGSRRFVAWMLHVSGFYALTQVLVLMTLGDEAADAYVFDTTVKGPYALIGASTYWYAVFVPRLYPRFISLLAPSSSSGSSTTQSSSGNTTNNNDEPTSSSSGTNSASSNSGICLSEKAFGYGWSALLLWQKGTMAALVGVMGMAASAIFFSILPPSLMDVPDVFVKILPWNSLGSLLMLDTSSKIYAPLLIVQNGGIGGLGGAGAGRRQAGRPRRQDGAGGNRRAAPVAAAAAAAAAAQPHVPNPSPEAIATLTGMGFDENSVREALQVTNNNVERAADMLLG